MNSRDQTYDYRRYLRAKRSVEARALNRNVWDQMAEQVRKFEGQIQVIELGAGIGSMALRFLVNDLLHQASYALVEQEASYVEEAQASLIAAAKKKDYQLKESSIGDIHLLGENVKIVFQFRSSDANGYFEDSERRASVDLLVAHAFLDLLNLERTLSKFFGALRPGAYFYFPITYDGLTSFEPQIDADFEAELLRLYHRTMDERLVDGLPSGDSQTGRHLFSAIESAGGRINAAGSSDWVVFPQQGGYSDDEAYFLSCILHTIEAALSGHAELDAARFRQWLSRRREQVEQAELVYIAHQLDIFGQKKNVA